MAMYNINSFTNVDVPQNWKETEKRNPSGLIEKNRERNVINLRIFSKFNRLLSHLTDI